LVALPSPLALLLTITTGPPPPTLALALAPVVVLLSVLLPLLVSELQAVPTAVAAEVRDFLRGWIISMLFAAVAMPVAAVAAS
jgi:hypothetical protein